MEKINVIVSWEYDNYSACTDDYDNIGGIVIATGKTIDILKKEFESALKFHIEGCLSDEDVLPQWVVSGDYEIEYIYGMSALLKRLDGILTRSAIARATGINERQLGHYATGLRKPRQKQRDKIIDGLHKISRELALVK